MTKRPIPYRTSEEKFNPFEVIYRFLYVLTNEPIPNSKLNSSGHMVALVSFEQIKEYAKGYSYVGVAMNLAKRMREHKYDAEHGIGNKKRNDLYKEQVYVAILPEGHPLEEILALEFELRPEANMGRNIRAGGGMDNPENRKFQSEIVKKRMASPEARKLQIDNAKKQWESPEARKAHSETMKIAMANPETKKLISENTKKYWASKKNRKSHSEKMKLSWARKKTATQQINK